LTFDLRLEKQVAFQSLVGPPCINRGESKSASSSSKGRIDEAGQLFYKVRIQQFNAGGINRWANERNSYGQVSKELGVVEKLACGNVGK